MAICVMVTWRSVPAAAFGRIFLESLLGADDRENVDDRLYASTSLKLLRAEKCATIET